MKYSVEYTPQAVKDLKKLDKNTCALIFAWIEKNLVDCDDPFRHGKSLTGGHSEKWRYRIGDYRLITHIQNRKVIILVLRVGHRREIYRYM